MAEEDAPPAIPAPWPCALAGAAQPGTKGGCVSVPAEQEQEQEEGPGPGDGKRRGRYVVTTRAVAAGEAVLEDAPYAAVVADAVRGYACARCLRLCTERVYQCGGCRLTHYCSEVGKPKRNAVLVPYV